MKAILHYSVTMLDNYSVGWLVINRFDLLFCIGLFAGADAHLSGNSDKCGKGHTGRRREENKHNYSDSVKVPLELCPYCVNDKNTQTWQSIVSLFQDSS